MVDTFDEEIRQAFEKMEPSTEAQKRILDAILSDSDIARETIAPKPQATKKVYAWNKIIPIAASLILLAGISFFAILPPSPDTDTFSASETFSDDKSAADSKNQFYEKEYGDTATTANESTSIMSPVYEDIYVESTSLGTLFFVDKNVDEKLIGEKIEDSSVQNTDGTLIEACSIFAYDFSGAEYYAIQYENDSTYYLAAPISE